MTHDDRDRWRSLPATRVDLGDGWDAAECVNPDGSITLWLLSDDPHANQETRPVVLPPHEQLGRLPAHVRDLISPPTYCVAIASSTHRRCRNRVECEGQSCQAHADKAIADGLTGRSWTHRAP